MNRIFSFIGPLAVIGMLLFTSCGKKLESGGTNSDYFPLQVGNYWEFNQMGTKSIDRIITLDGKDYFRMISVFSNLMKDTLYLRKTSDGKIYSRKLTSAESLLYDLYAPVNDSWQNGEMKVTLTKIDQEKVLGNTTVKHCLVFYCDPRLMMADDEYTWTLAPGIGYVYYFALGGTYNQNFILKKALINGVETSYE